MQASMCILKKSRLPSILTIAIYLWIASYRIILIYLRDATPIEERGSAVEGDSL
jgi:hypothetical protein